MNIPLVDLKAQYRSIQGEIDSAVKQVISETDFIGGSYCKSFENENAPEVNNHISHRSECNPCENSAPVVEIYKRRKKYNHTRYCRNPPGARLDVHAFSFLI